jgi:hypothetical protein
MKVSSQPRASADLPWEYSPRYRYIGVSVDLLE